PKWNRRGHRCDRHIGTIAAERIKRMERKGPLIETYIGDRQSSVDPSSPGMLHERSAHPNRAVVVTTGIKVGGAHPDKTVGVRRPRWISIDGSAEVFNGSVWLAQISLQPAAALPGP